MVGGEALGGGFGVGAEKGVVTVGQQILKSSRFSLIASNDATFCTSLRFQNRMMLG